MVDFQYVVFSIAMVVIMVAVYVVVINPVFQRITKAGETLVPTEEETPPGTTGGSQISLLPIDQNAPASEKIRIFFDKFSLDYIHTDSSGKRVYNVFIFDIPAGSFSNPNAITIPINDGLKSWNAANPDFQIGPDDRQPPLCASRGGTGIKYSEDCWNSYADSLLNDKNTFLSQSGGASCLFLTNQGTDNNYNGKVKMRIGWFESGSASNDKKIIYYVASICDDSSG